MYLLINKSGRSGKYNIFCSTKTNDECNFATWISNSSDCRGESTCMFQGKHIYAMYVYFFVWTNWYLLWYSDTGGCW
jgi:hypothetical protein